MPLMNRIIIYDARITFMRPRNCVHQLNYNDDDSFFFLIVKSFKCLMVSKA